MIVLDTNVLVYAAGRDHPLRDWCFGLMDAVAEGRLDATTTVEVVQEFLHISSRSRSLQDAGQLTAEYASLLAPLVVTTERELRAGVRLFERHRSLDAFDAVLAAVAIVSDARALVSADKAFASIPRLRHIDPATTHLAELVVSS